VTGETGTELRASDAALIARIVERDESALAALYDRYAGMLSSVLNRILRDAQAAEEILQDIFYQLWRTAARFDPARGSLPGWLLVIARNRAISRLRRHNPASGDEVSGKYRGAPDEFGEQHRSTANDRQSEKRAR
jgi:RNA polymerase sigma-70 factor (ECF subfamily)